MKPLDTNYLLLQFRDKIYSKNGTEFQSFFENIMEKAISDFKKVPSGGGDGGNDGWIKRLGRYYQVYAPNTPATKDSAAAKKLKENFQDLKDNWDEVSEIKEYYFVFNDKYFGSKKPEVTITELEGSNPDIQFNTFLAKDLEKVFFELSETDILNLGFNIDSRQAVSIVNEYLQKVEIELDRECAKFAVKILEDSKDIISKLGDEELSLEYEILECRCLYMLEKVDEAKGKYKDIAKRFPSDPRAFLYLSEIYLFNKDFSKNKEMLVAAAKISKNYWHLRLVELVRKNYLREKIALADIDEKSFTDDLRIKSRFYRLYTLLLEDSGHEIMADSFIEKAISLNPDRLCNYIIRLSVLRSRMLQNQDNSQILQQSHELLEGIEKVEKMLFGFGDIRARNKAALNFMKLDVFRVQDNYLDFGKVSQETFNLVITCYFDQQIDQILAGFLVMSLLSDNDFDKLLRYLKNSKKEISEELSKVLIFQFNIRDSLFVEGKDYFKKTGNQKYLDFITDLENKDYENILKFLTDDIPFAVTVADVFKNLPVLRRKIIETLPDDKNILKQKLLILLNYDEKDIGESFKILKDIDLANLSYLECMSFLEIVQKKKAWDFEVIILEKLLEKEKNEKVIFNLNVQLFNAYFKLKKYIKVIEIGEKLLYQDSVKKDLDTKNREALLTHTIFACFEREMVDGEMVNKSHEILEKYKLVQPTFEFKVGIEAEVYLKNDDPNKALKSVIEGVKIRKVLTPEEYAELYFLMSVKIGNQINLNLDSLNIVEENTFVKVKNRERWYFIGEDNELDAIKISKKNNRYPSFINQSLGAKIVFEDKYSSENREEIVENIFLIEKYILWQALYYMQKLSEDNVLDGVQKIEVREKDGTIDTKYIKKFLEDIDKRTKPFFELYCKGSIPLAMLVSN